MKHLLYGFSTVLVNDDVATSMIEYAAALNQSALTDVVSVPTVDLAGCRTSAQMLLAPGIPLMVEDAADDALEQPDAAFVHEIEMRTAAVAAGARKAR